MRADVSVRYVEEVKQGKQVAVPVQDLKARMDPKLEEAFAKTDRSGAVEDAEKTIATRRRASIAAMDENALSPELKKILTRRRRMSEVQKDLPK